MGKWHPCHCDVRQCVDERSRRSKRTPPRHSNVEAAVQIRNRTVAGEVRDWFDGLFWDLATPVNDEMLTDARHLWRRKQGFGRVSAAIMEHRILAYCWGRYSEQALDHWNDNQGALFTKEEREKFEQQEIEPFYEIGPEWAQIPSRGTVIVDFSCRKERQRFECYGSLFDKARSRKARKQQLVGLPVQGPELQNAERSASSIADGEVLGGGERMANAARVRRLLSGS